MTLRGATERGPGHELAGDPDVVALDARPGVGEQADRPRLEEPRAGALEDPERHVVDARARSRLEPCERDASDHRVAHAETSRDMHGPGPVTMARAGPGRQVTDGPSMAGADRGTGGAAQARRRGLAPERGAAAYDRRDAAGQIRRSTPGRARDGERPCARRSSSSGSRPSQVSAIPPIAAAIEKGRRPSVDRRHLGRDRALDDLRRDRAAEHGAGVPRRDLPLLVRRTAPRPPRRHARARGRDARRPVHLRRAAAGRPRDVAGARAVTLGLRRDGGRVVRTGRRRPAPRRRRALGLRRHEHPTKRDDEWGRISAASASAAAATADAG